MSLISHYYHYKDHEKAARNTEMDYLQVKCCTKRYHHILGQDISSRSSTQHTSVLWRTFLLMTFISLYNGPKKSRIHSIERFQPRPNNNQIQASSRFLGNDSGNYFSIWLNLEVIFILILMVWLTQLLLSVNSMTCFVEGHYISLEDYQGARHYKYQPPNLSKPCDHPFRDSPDNSAIISEVVLIGSAISFESSLPFNRYLYYANIQVKSVLKTPKFIVYPIRPNHVIKIGIFNYYEDRARCMPDIQLFRDYIFFQQPPDWSGISKIAQLPHEYTQEKYFIIRDVLYGKYQQLEMTYVKPSENLIVSENDDLKLECRAEGLPKPTISWHFGPNEIKRNFIKTSIDGLESSIDLLNMTQANQGNYTCRANNAYGSIQRSIQVTVIKKPTTRPATTPAPHPCHNYCQNGSCYLDGGIPRCSCPNRYHGLQCELALQDFHQSQLSVHQHAGETRAIDLGFSHNVITGNNSSNAKFGQTPIHGGDQSTYFCKDCDSSFNKVFFLASLSFISVLLISVTIFFILNKKRFKLFTKRFNISNCHTANMEPFTNFEINSNQAHPHPRDYISSVYDATITRNMNDPYFLTPKNYRHDNVIANLHGKSLSCNLYNINGGGGGSSLSPEQLSPYIYTLNDPLNNNNNSTKVNMMGLQKDVPRLTHHHPSPLFAYKHEPNANIPCEN